MTEYEMEPMEEAQGFTIDCDSKAKWALDKIQEARKDTENWTAYYEEQLNRIKTRNENTEAFFTAKLAEFFEAVPHHDTKTASSYQLPNGKLTIKHQGVKYERDDPALVDWLIKNGHDSCVRKKVTFTPDWEFFKRHITVLKDGSIVDDSTGAIVEGVKAVPQGDVFKVDIL